MNGFRVMGQNSCEISIPVLALGDDWVTGDPIEIQVVEPKFLFLRSSRFKVSVSRKFWRILSTGGLSSPKG